MRHERIVIAVGDIHGNFAAFNSAINSRVRQSGDFRRKAADPDIDFGVIILQAGDLGWFWAGEDNRGKIRNAVDWLAGGRVPIYWCGGNHDDWDQIDALGPGIAEVDSGLFHCAFGSVLDIGPKHVLFCGGAESSDEDREWRLREQEKLPFRVWWPQEGVSEADLERLDAVPAADWIVSHSAPSVFRMPFKLRDSGIRHACDPSRKMLNRVFMRHHPERWLFGHFHREFSGTYDGCEWRCLNMLGGNGSWVKLDVAWDD